MRIEPNAIAPPKKSPPPKKPEIPEIKFDGRRRCKDWIISFLDYTEQQESPVDFLRWTALATVAGAAQRKIYIDMEYFMVLSNMFVCLTGPPGTKKTTAIRQGRKLLYKVPGINLTSDAPSVVGLMDDFEEVRKANPAHQSLNGFIYELSSLFENAEQTMTGFLTTIYDGDDSYTKKTRVGGTEHIPFPWLNIVAGTTPAWLGSFLSKASIEGGYVARNIYVYSDEIILKTPRPKKSPALDKLKEDLAHDLARISALSGEFKFTDEAGDWYDAWYLDKDGRFPRITDNRTAGYYVRKPYHLLKAAMALSLAKSDSLILTIDDLEIAKAFLEAAEPGMLKALSSVGGNTYANDIERIRAQIVQAGPGGISKQELWTANYHSIEESKFDAAVASIVAMGDARTTMCKVRLLDGTEKVDKLYTALIHLNGNGKDLHGVKP